MSIRDLLKSVQTGALSATDARNAIDSGVAEQARMSGGYRAELEPVAIIGMSGRYPEAPDLAHFWAMLAAGRDAVTEIPPTRWRVDDYYDPSLPRTGKMYAKWLGQLADIECFDPLFFAISPGEAEFMDPQHRMFMQESYKAFEDAGYAGALGETNCGVYFGVMSREYGDLLLENQHLGMSVTGVSNSIGASRLSYYLNLKGPAIAVDTACSSSLVATHLACQALRAREIDMALAGGATVYLAPGAFVGMCSAGMLSPSGRCKAFDDTADGFVPGEGVGAVVLKRLADAEADGDVIHGVIIGSGINQDGKTNGMTAPCKSSQIELTRSIYRKYDIDPESIGYVEMHGTGTNLGDPIELSALATAFRDHTAKRDFCAIGSVKSNIGHTSAAAGMAGIHKVLLCMRYGMQVPTLHFTTPNRHFDFAGSPFHVNTTFRPWPREGDRPLRAAISSFGYSGTNAHMVIEQYTPAAAPARAAGPFVFVLSALNEEALRRYATDMLRFVRTHHHFDLNDLTYTLQVGRAQREQRLALVVDTVEQLAAGLESYLSCEDDDAVRCGNVEPNSLVDALADRDDIGEMQQRWFHDDQHRLIDLWVKGLDVDWGAVRKPSPARRISLPTYPFARDRFWLDFASLRVRANRPAMPAATRRTWWQFSGNEFFLDGHRVDGRRVLPAAQCLEMARAAAASCFGDAVSGRCIELFGVTWRQPVVLAENISASLPLSLCIDLNDVGEAVWEFTLLHSDTIHCRGRARLVEPVAETATLSDGGDEIAADELYAILERMGIHYGAANRGIEKLIVTRDEAYAWLAVPESAFGKDFTLHPTMLDSALQATLGPAIYGHDAAQDAPSSDARASLPFALDAIRIYASTTARMTVRVRRASAGGALHKFDLDLADEQQQVRVSLRGFSSMPAKTAVAPEIAAEPVLKLLAPVWQRMPDEPPTPIEHDGAVLVFGASAEQFAEVANAYPDAVDVRPAAAFDADECSRSFTAAVDRPGGRIGRVFWFTPTRAGDGDDATAGARLLFGLLKAVLANGGGLRPLVWTVVTVRAQAVTEAEVIAPEQAALAGLVGSMAKEYPHWRVQLLDLDDDAVLSAAALARAPLAVDGGVCARRDSWWFAQHLAPVEVAAWPACVRTEAFQSAYRHGGLYVVVGGAGGIGETWTESMIRRYDAQVIWLGRRAEDDAIRARLDRLATLGRRPLYIAADAVDLNSLRHARSEITARFGSDRPINGIVHSAIVLNDQSLANMTLDQFSGSLRAKVDISVNLARLFENEPLDFVLFFSSMQSFVKAAGQANYAAGCTFEDAFARHLQARWPCAVKTINWGYWGNVGVVATPEHRRKMAKLGLVSIEAEEGMETLELLLTGPLQQLALVKMTHPDVARQWCPTRQTLTLLAPLAVADVEPAQPPVPTRDDGAGTEREAQLAIDAVMARLLSVQLRRIGRSAELSTLAQIRRQIDRKYRDWFDESVRILDARGLLAPGGDALDDADIDDAALTARWDADIAELRAAPGTTLVESTLMALPEILGGRVAATEVLFHDTTLSEVEGVYRGNVVADFYNATLADALVAHVERQRAAGGRLRILEIGAGTGGTSALLFERLRAFSDSIDEYRYTDVSRAFLLHAQAHYCADNPYVTCSLFDVEKPLQEQGIDIGAYDAVVASNVLHATRDIRNALRNAKAALKKGGVLLINEISRKSVFTHLTFGLLKGWWLAEDSGLRISGSPVLAPDTWARVLRGEGFAPVRFPSAEAHGDGQQVIVANSDGVICQLAAEPSAHSEAVRAESAAAREAIPVKAADSSLRTRIVQLIAGVVGAVLKLEPDQINPRMRLEKYGLDSILAVQMAARLNTVLDDVTTTLFIEYQTIEALADHLLATRHAELVHAFGGDPSTPAGSAALRSQATASAAAATPAARDLTSAAQQAVAIIGIGGRFPSASSVGDLWERLVAGEDCLGEVPVSRWDHEQYFDPDRSRLGKTYCRWGGFIDGVDEFDPLFFDFSPTAADFTDPQVRLFLQTTWEVLEKAGYTRNTIESKYGSQVGVYVGAMYQQYQTLEMDYMAHAGVSLSSYSAISNRVSNFFDFKGPSVAVDTQCSSALIAVHMARQSLVAGECELAVAGAINLILSPKKYIGLSIPLMLGSHERCRSFADGDGFLPSEGVGAVLLKPLARAIADGDPIHAVIRASTQSHGGRGVGYGTQDPNAQYELISRCLNQSGVDVRSISYVEAAANGTGLSDTMEAAALKRAFAERTQERGFCTIGSVKSNIGHSESASGIAQLAKIVMQMRHRTLPPTIHLEQPNPNLNFEGSAFLHRRTAAPWNRPVVADGRGEPVEMPRRALLDSFGGGGSIACALIEEYAPDLPSAVSSGVAPPPPATRAPAVEQVITLSARNEERLRAAAARLRDYLRDRPGVPLADVAYTLQAGREAMESRLAFVAASTQVAVQALTSYLDGDSKALATGTVDSFDSAAVPADASDPTPAGLVALAAAWCEGRAIDWQALHAGTRVSIVELPTYPFERRHCWLPAGGASDYGDSLRELDASYKPRVLDGGDLHDAVHVEISSVLGLDTAELARDAALARFELPQVLMPRLRHHLQKRLGLELDSSKLTACRTTQDILDLVPKPAAKKARKRRATEKKTTPEENKRTRKPRQRAASKKSKR